MLALLCSVLLVIAFPLLPPPRCVAMNFLGIPGAHSWEGWDPIDAGAPNAPADWDDSDEEPDIDYDNLSVQDASEMFEDLLISLKLAGRLNATQCCTLAFFAHKAGCPGDMLKQLAVKPTAHSGRFSRVFDEVLGSSPKDANLYEVGVPMRLRHEAARVCHHIPTLSPPRSAPQ